MFASNKWSPLNVYSSQSKFDCGEWREEGWLGHSCKQWRKRNICYDTDKAKMIIACKCWQMQQSSLLLLSLKSPRRITRPTSICTLQQDLLSFYKDVRNLMDLFNMCFTENKLFWKHNIVNQSDPEWSRWIFRPSKWSLIIFSVWLLNPTMTTPPCAEPNPESTSSSLYNLITIDTDLLKSYYCRSSTSSLPCYCLAGANRFPSCAVSW